MPKVQTLRILQVGAKIKIFFNSLGGQLLDIWNRSKIFLIAIGALLLALEFKKIKEALLLYAGKKEIQTDEKQDQVLADKEHKDSGDADKLVQKSKEESADDDWYKK